MFLCARIYLCVYIHKLLYSGNLSLVKFLKMLKVEFLRLQISGIVVNNNNAWAGGNEQDWIGANKISELQSYEVATVNLSQDVYVAVWKAAVG